MTSISKPTFLHLFFLIFHTLYFITSIIKYFYVFFFKLPYFIYFPFTLYLSTYFTWWYRFLIYLFQIHNISIYSKKLIYYLNYLSFMQAQFIQTYLSYNLKKGVLRHLVVFTTKRHGYKFCYTTIKNKYPFFSILWCNTILQSCYVLRLSTRPKTLFFIAHGYPSKAKREDLLFQGKIHFFKLISYCPALSTKIICVPKKHISVSTLRSVHSPFLLRLCIRLSISQLNILLFCRSFGLWL